MKTKWLIIYAITAQLICSFVFAYANSRFSNDAAQMSFLDESIIKILNIQTHKSCLNHSKILQDALRVQILHQQDADEMANCADPGLTLHLRAVLFRSTLFCKFCPGLPVCKLKLWQKFNSHL